jgi:2'-hydroxyisoflavone reductase
MELLLLGGPLFIGRAVIDSALAAGHSVTIFSRGRTNPALYPECERLIGDRDGHLDALRGRSWDACIDTSGYVPRVVRASAELLAPNVGFYVFISSMAVYADLSGPLDESSPLRDLPEPSEDVDRYYGPLKALCEEVLDDTLDGRAAHLRPQLIVGPHDATGRFTYWPVRIARGGRVLAPDVRGQLVQCVDVRDLAAFAVRLAGTRVPGPYVIDGPRELSTFGDVIDSCLRISGSGAEIVWAPEQFLRDQGVQPWIGLPLWYGDVRAGMHSSNARARQEGLELRPLDETVADTLAWALADPESAFRPDPGRNRVRPGIEPERERDLMELLAASGSIG